MATDDLTERGIAAAKLRANSEAILHRMEESNITPLRTDAVIAAELRSELGPLLELLLDIMSKARAEGFEISWTIQPDSFGRHLRCTEIAIKKQL